MNNQSSKGITIRVAPLCGDGEILIKAPRSKLWKSFFDPKLDTLMIIITTFIRIKLAMLSFAGSALFRYKYGGRTVGLILTMLTFLMLIGWNSSFLYLIAKPFFPFGFWCLLPFKNIQFWQGFFFEEIKSMAMLIYSFLHLGVALFHSGCIYFGYGDKSEPTKRGSSLLYNFFLKYHGISEYYVQAAIEPLLLGAIAALFWLVFDDKTFALFLVFSGFTLFLQEVLDRATQMQHRTS